jgi:nicotinate dehydrogenase subunit B
VEEGRLVGRRIVVNGTERDVELEPDRSLLHILREELGLTGAKYGCGEGACGACTVLVAGRPIRACTMPIGDVRGPVVTVEGLAPEGHLHPVARAFLEAGATQCGYCTPGMVVAAAALLESTAHPDDAEIVEALDGNICRCGVYRRIVRAVRIASGLKDEPVGVLDPIGAYTRPAEPWDLTPPDDRDYFAVLPDGLVVAIDPGPDDGSSWSTTRDAWIHVGDDGFVTAFIGKVNVGQDNRTALCRLIAGELRVPLERVRLVMGDTDICPFDMGTFGSRSMPDAGPVVRSAAAAMRDELIAIAADRWEVDPVDLEPDAGSVHRRGVEGSLSYGELVRGRQSVVGVPMVVPTERPVSDPTHGRSETATVSGVRRFTSDMTRPGLLHGAVLRPPSFGSSLRSLDVADAEALADVSVVREDDLIGIVASDPVTAARALGSIRSEWDMSDVVHVSDADLDPHLRSHPVEAEGWGGSFHHEEGDLDRAFVDADVSLERTYSTAYIAHAPLETRVALAEWEGERLTVWTATQRPFGVREELATALRVPERDVRVIVLDAGGGYGGKHTGEVAVEAARLARAAGAPVKVRWSREEESTWAYFRPAAVIDVHSAVQDGALTAFSFTNINAGTPGIETPYDIPNQRIVFQPADSPLRQGSYRGLAATANHFARESHMDEVAGAIDADPVRFRLDHLSDERLIAVLEAAADRAGWADARSSGAGKGIACGTEKDAYVATCAEVRVDDDGRLRLLRIVTAFDCGAIVDADNLVSQIEGATVMGLGGALTERIRFSNGRIENARFSEYPMPRFSDIPPIEVVLLDRPDISSAGAGETPIVCVAPAVANAIAAACGVRLRSMPLAPDGIIDRGSIDAPVVGSSA